MDPQNEVDVNAIQAEAMARGLYAVALVDGAHERELALISELYQAAIQDEAAGASTIASLDRVGPLGPRELAAVLVEEEHRELFLHGAFLCAWADGKVSAGERAKIGEFAKALGIADDRLGKLEAQVKDYLLRPLAGLANVDAAAAVAKKLGV